MSILLSVNPPFSGWFVDGEKTIILRKKPLPVGKAYIYETKKSGGSGKVIGEVHIMRSTKEDVGDLFGKMYDQFSTVPDIVNFLKEGKISKEDLVKYGNGNSVYACECCEAFRFITPLPLSEFRVRKKIRGYHKQGENFAERLLHGGRVEVKQITRPPQSWCYVEDLKGDAK